MKMGNKTMVVKCLKILERSVRGSEVYVPINQSDIPSKVWLNIQGDIENWLILPQQAVTAFRMTDQNQTVFSLKEDRIMNTLSLEIRTWKSFIDF